MTVRPGEAVRIRRAYEEPGPDDGRRVLVDRVWPRGRTRDEEHNQAVVIAEEVRARLAL